MTEPWWRTCRVMEAKHYIMLTVGQARAIIATIILLVVSFLVVTVFVCVKSTNSDYLHREVIELRDELTVLHQQVAELRLFQFPTVSSQANLNLKEQVSHIFSLRLSENNLKTRIIILSVTCLDDSNDCVVEQKCKQKVPTSKRKRYL